jgi:hypothetical protein
MEGKLTPNLSDLELLIDQALMHQQFNFRFSWQQCSSALTDDILMCANLSTYNDLDHFLLREEITAGDKGEGVVMFRCMLLMWKWN